MKLLLRILFLCISFSFLNNNIYATHIVGGNLSFTSSQSGVYQFTLKAYKECESGNNHFDSSPQSTILASVSVYLGDSLFIPSIYLLPPVINEFESDGLYPCKILPDDICFEEAVYTFEAILPLSDSAYTLIYQRCCLEGGIVNIDNALSSGLSIQTVITPQGQLVNNNSAEFIFEPIGVLCIDETIDFGYELFDPDGDSLSYKFCSPLTEVMDLDARDPEPPPPYTLAIFNAPDYNVNAPLAGIPVVGINAADGSFLGIPNLLGPHFFGVCVEEYRNGQLIHTNQFDYVLNVVECPDLINATIVADSIAVDQQELVVCDFDETIFLENISTDSNFIFAYEWQLFLDAGTQIFTEKDVSLNLDAPENFNGLLIANPGEECVDTLFFDVLVSPQLETALFINGDTCTMESLDLAIDIPTTYPIAIDEYLIEIENDISVNNQQYTHQFDPPDNYLINYQVIDENGCIDGDTITFSYFPVPEDIDLTTTFNSNCLPVVANFELNQLSDASDYSILWNYGDGIIEEANTSVSHQYNQVGNFLISVNIQSENGCEEDYVFPNQVQADSIPVANFNAMPSSVSIFNAEVTFQNTSQLAQSYQWIFENNETDFSINPKYEFTLFGNQPVTLIASSLHGCADTITQLILVDGELTYHIPNVFSPNYDGNNDIFIGKGQLEQIATFQMEVYNRYGELIFISSDPMLGWNGKKFNSGQIVQKGMYTYFLRITTPFDTSKTFKGNIMLLR